VTRVSLVATARPTFAVDVARSLAARARSLLEELGADIAGPAELVLTSADVDAAAPLLDPDADLRIHVCASFCDADPAVRLHAGSTTPVLLWAFREPGPVGDRLWLNSLCGANLLGHALALRGVQVRLLHGDPGEPSVRRALADALAGTLPEGPSLAPGPRGGRADRGDARTRLRTLRGRRVGVVGDAPPGFTPSAYDAGVLDRLFGLRVEAIGLPDAFDRVRAVPGTDVATERKAAVAAQPSLAGVAGDEVDGSAAVTQALRGWATEESLAAVAVQCWPEFPTELRVCPCSSLSRLADEGTPTACERDVYGITTMLLLEAMGSGPTYLVDTVDLDADQNLVRVWHCGSAATALAADPGDAEQSVHCNRRIGVAGNFALRTGPVILARLTEQPDRPDRLRLLLASGTSIPEPNRFQGNTAGVRLDTDAERFVHGLVTGGFPHHTVVAWTDVRDRMRAAADDLEIPVVEL
jgi:L-fucose isomerase-like protein